MNGNKPVAVITGASSGIGAATAVKLAETGYDVVVGARRADRLKEVAERCGGRPLTLDVTKTSSVEQFAAQIERVDVLVNNAGMALEMETIAELPEEHAREMWETNVLGVLLVTRALLPRLEEAHGHIVNVTSTSAYEIYPGGAGYTSTKHAMRAVGRTLRFELLGKPIRVTDVAPGLVETEFSQVRFPEDRGRAAKIYEGLSPLTGDDVAECIAWAVTRPPHVNVDELLVRPTAQFSATVIARSRDPAP